jgi:hypothetical protein
MKFLLPIWFLIICQQTIGQENFPVGARQAALANAAVTLTDVWSAHHNQAGLGFIRKLTAGVYYENRFLVPELGLSSAVVAIPAGKGCIGISFRNFGFNLYQESKAGIGYGRMFGDNLSIGMQLNYHLVSFSEIYGNRSLVTAEAGAIYKLSKKLLAGAHVYNPGQPIVSEFGTERLPAAIRFGLRYQFSDKIMLATEAEMISSRKPILRMGLEYEIQRILYLRAGIASNPLNSSFGLGVRLKKFMFDLAGAFHPVLGFSPKFSLSYTFGE